MMDDEHLRDASDGSGLRPSTDFCPTAYTYETKKSLNHSDRNRKDGVLKKKVCKISGGGLREYSLRGCKKVADEIIAEFAAEQSNSLVSLDEVRKEIQWKGLPNSNARDVEEIKVLRSKLVSTTGKKAAYLKDLEDQVADLQNLILLNRELLKFGTVPQGFSLPFILVQTKPHASVEIKISEDMQLVHFDFNSTPFALHDDAYILRLLHHYQLLESENISQTA